MSTPNTTDSTVTESDKERRSEHSISELNNKSAQQVHSGKSKSYAKTSKLYWTNKVKRPPSSTGGESPHFGIQLSFQGRRMRFPLDSGNRDTAASKAAQIWTMLAARGWKETLAKFKPEAAKSAHIATVGELIEAATRLSSARTESLDVYAKALRRITAAVVGLEDGRKYDFKRGSHEWREKVDATGLDKLTPAKVLAWKNGFLKVAKTPEERKCAIVTVNSLIRNSKALVSKKVLPFVVGELNLPSPLWFQGIISEEEPSLRYKSKLDAAALIEAASRELAESQPEAFKLLLLTLVCGLRRSEADALLWSQFDMVKGTISIEDNEFKRLKSKDSHGEIGLDAKVLAMFKGYHARANCPFVLETPKLARTAFSAHKSRGYRCEATQRILLDWLRANGVQGLRPIHTLRKEIGSIIASRDGIFKASRYLRHSDIRITSRLYADTKQPVSAGLDDLFTAPASNVIAAEFKPAEKASKSKGKTRRA